MKHIRSEQYRADIRSMEKAFLFVERFALVAGLAIFAIGFLMVTT